MQCAKILRVDKTGFPVSWVSPKEASSFIFNNRVLWSHGKESVILNGGINRFGERSRLEIPAIIATDGRDKSANDTPALCRRVLYERDSYTCQYCSHKHSFSNLSMDHIFPQSRGGETSFTNLITSCKRCNNKKRDRTPEEAGMELLAIPFIPNRQEFLYLTNRRILNTDQMDYLRSSIRDELLIAA